MARWVRRKQLVTIEVEWEVDLDIEEITGYKFGPANNWKWENIMSKAGFSTSKNPKVTVETAGPIIERAIED